MTQTTRYASVLAKIGAERSRLLNEAKLKTLSESKNLQEFVSQLRETSYQDQISKLSTPLTSRKLERVFYENLISVTAKIIKNSPNHVEKFLFTYLYKFEIENVKALIKATNAKLSTEQKLSILYLSAEDYLKNRAVIEEAAKVQTIKQVVNVLKRTECALALTLGLQSYEEDGTTACIDVLLDKVFLEELCNAYESLPKEEKPHAFFYVSIENDSFTLLTLLSGKILNYDANWLRLAVPKCNFKIYEETLEKMAMSVDFDSAFKVAVESYYSGFFLRVKIPEETIADAERAFKSAVLQHAKTGLVSDSFSVGAPLAFLTQKEAEVRNLIAISSGVGAEIKPDDIQHHLLL